MTVVLSAQLHCQIHDVYLKMIIFVRNQGLAHYNFLSYYRATGMRDPRIEDQEGLVTWPYQLWNAIISTTKMLQYSGGKMFLAIKPASHS